MKGQNRIVHQERTRFFKKVDTIFHMLYCIELWAGFSCYCWQCPKYSVSSDECCFKKLARSEQNEYLRGPQLSRIRKCLTEPRPERSRKRRGRSLRASGHRGRTCHVAAKVYLRRLFADETFRAALSEAGLLCRRVFLEGYGVTIPKRFVSTMAQPRSSTD